MITCALSPKQIELLYKHTYKSLKGQVGKEFQSDSFMKDLYKKMLETSDADTAAKFIQPLPTIIANLITTDFVGQISGIDYNELFTQAAEFLKPEGISTIINKFTDKPNIKKLKAAKKNAQKNKGNVELIEEGNQGDGGGAPPKPNFSPRRILSRTPFTGTMIPFVAVDPNTKEVTFGESLDVNKKTIINTLDALAKATNLQEDITKFVYQGRELSLKAQNLNEFTNDDNTPYMDATTVADVVRSRVMIGKKLTVPGVVQANAKVILVVSDEAGNNVYFDEEGNITEKENGKLVYQFMRNTTYENGKYVVKDFFNKNETIVSAEEIAKQTYDEKIDGDYKTYLAAVRKEQAKEIKELYDLKEEILNTGAKKLPIFGITTGVPSNLTETRIALNNITKFPGITDKVYNSITFVKSGENKGRAKININNNSFLIDRPEITKDLSSEIADVLLNPKLSSTIKAKYLNQFIPNNISAQVRKHNLIIDGDNILFDIYPETGLIGKSAEYDFSNNKLTTYTEKQLAFFKGEIEKALNTGYGGKPTVINYDENSKKNTTYLKYNSQTGAFELQPYMPYITSLPAVIHISNLDPGVYNYGIQYGKPGDEINSFAAAIRNSVKEKENAAIQNAIDIKNIKDALVERLKAGEEITGDIAKPINSGTALDFFEKDGSRASLYNFGTILNAENFDITEEALASGNKLGLTARLVLEPIVKTDTNTFYDVVQVYVGDKYIGNVRETSNAEFNKANTVSPVANAIEIVEKVIEPEMPSPDNTESIVSDVLSPDVDINDIPDIEALWNRKGYASEELSKKVKANAEKWWKESPSGKILSKFIGLEHAANLVNSDVYARFIASAAFLADPENPKLAMIEINPAKGSFVDVYHEAWHGFSQLFLTKEDKYKLYNELRDYTDAKGNQPNAGKSYFELEEILAEDFRTYSKNQTVVPGATERNSLFRQMLNFIKALFGKVLKKFSRLDATLNSMNSPMAKELFNNLYFGKINNYTPLLENAEFFELDRGFRKVNRPKETAVGMSDTQLLVQSIDSKFSDLIDVIYNKSKATRGIGAKSASILMLTDPSKRAWMYSEVKKDFEFKLAAEKKKLGKIANFKDFNTIESLDDLKANAVGILKSNKGRDKYIFLKSQIDNFDNLEANNKKGDRVKGESWRDIKIVADFYTHKSIKKGKAPANIMVVSRLEDAEIQLKNYIEGGAEQYTSVQLQQLPQPNLTAEQELIQDNIRILTAAIDNFGDEKSGLVKYHMQNSDYEIGTKKYDVDYIDGEEVDETDIDNSSDNRDGDSLDANKVGKKSLQQMMSKETIYILKSLFKVDAQGNTPVNRLGFKERADFKKVFNITAKAIGGIRNRTEAYERLRDEAAKFPEIKQLFETKYPNPDTITNTFEFDISRQFWQDFGRPKVQYWEIRAIPTYTTTADSFGQTNTTISDYDLKSMQSSLDTASILSRWESDFKGSAKTKYIKKTINNESVLDLEKVVKDFGKNNELNEDLSFEFAQAIGAYFDNVKALKDDVNLRPEYYGLPFIYKIAQKFNEYDRNNVAGAQITEDQAKYLQDFVRNPIRTLTQDIPNKVMPLFKGAKVNQNTQVKRLVEIQSKYGYDSSNLGVIRADGNKAYENMEYSSMFGKLEAFNSAESFEDLVAMPHMSYLDENVNSFSKKGRSKILSSIFAMNSVGQGKIDGRSLNAIYTSGTSIENGDGTNTTDLDPLGKFLQEAHSMSLSGIAELPRTSEKKSSFGIRVEGGIARGLQGDVLKGEDLYLYTDMNMFANGTGEDFAIGEYFIGYVATEFDRIKRFKSYEREELLRLTRYNDEIKKDVNGNPLVSGELFTAFDSVLSDEVKDDLYALAEQQLELDLEDYLDQNKDLKDRIAADIKNYFKWSVAEHTREYLSQGSFFSKSLYEKMGYKVENNKDLKALRANTEISKQILQGYLYNDWIHKFETSLLFIGDFSQWNHGNESWSKRIPGLTSGGYGYLYDDATVSFINDVFNASDLTYAGRKEKETGVKYDNFEYGPTLRTAVVKDAKRTSVYLQELKEAWEEEYAQTMSAKEAAEAAAIDAETYDGMTESDGFAVLTLDAYRTLHKTGRGWSLAQEDLYQKIIRGEYVEPKTAKENFPVYKLHYFGALANVPIATTAMHKFAIMPLIPSKDTENSELHKLHLKMLRDNIQYLTFESGSKASTYIAKGEVNGTEDNIFADKDDKTINEDAILTPNEIYMAYLKEVTVISEKLKEEIPIATQTRVINIDNLYDNGELINKKNTKTLDNYTSAIKNYSDLLKEELLNEIGFEYKNGKYEGKLTKFIELIREELGNRSVPEHLIKLLNTTINGQLAMDLSLHPEADGIEKLVMSVIFNRLIKQKTRGEKRTQVPSTFSNGTWDTEYSLLKDPADIEKYLGSNTLPFYRRGEIINAKTKERAPTNLAKVAISFSGEFTKLLKLKDANGVEVGTIEKLNQLIKDDEWLAENRKLITLFGPRIPNDATNTISAFEVWHFTNPANGTTIILPTEIVAQAGSDFDADSLFLMQPNLNNDGTLVSEGVEDFTNKLQAAKTAKEGPTPEQLIGLHKRFLQNQYLQASVDVITIPENYAYLTRPNQTYLVEKYVKDLEKYSEGYDRFKNPSNVPNEIRNKRAISPTRLLEAGYNLYKHDSNLSLNASLSIQAKITKNHALYKALGVPMPLTYKKQIWDNDQQKYVDSNIDIDMMLRFKHNTITKNGKEHISLSGNRTAKGSRITDVNSHALNGILDRAKNPFPFVLMMVPEGINVINHMITAGVSEEEVYYFVNQPLIKKYINRTRNLSGAYASILDPARYGNPATIAAKEVIADYVKQNNIDTFIQEANLLNQRDVLNYLYKKDKNAEFFFKVGKKTLKGSVAKLLNSVKQGEIDLEYLNRITSVAKENEQARTYYSYTNNVTSQELYPYFTKVISDAVFGGKDITIDDLKSNLELKDVNSIQSLAYFMNFIEIQNQIKGMESLEMMSTGDTSKLGTVQQVIKRKDTLEALGESSKVDQEFFDRLKDESILASFNQTDLILDLVLPLFPMRLNEKITNYISDTLKSQSRTIKKQFGQGVRGQEYFTTKYNNAVMNFIFQNYKSNYVNGEGRIANLPDAIDSREVVINNNIQDDVIVTKGQIIVNTKNIEEDYRNKAFLVSNISDRSYTSRGLDVFTPKQNPFNNIGSYYKYVVERELLRASNTIESLKGNKSFEKYVVKYKSPDAGFEAYISERALLQGFNRAYIMGTTKYNYTDGVLDLVNELDPVYKLKANYSVLAQLSPAKVSRRDNVRLIELNDKGNAVGELADVYAKQIVQLADPSVIKAKGIDNERISDIFSVFSQMMYYQHGMGNSRLGFVKAIDATGYKEVMQTATLDFQRNHLKKENFDLILSRLLEPTTFKNYSVSAAQYNNPELLNITDEEFEDDFEDPDFIKEEGEEPSKPLNPVANIPQNKVSGIESFGSLVTANPEVIKALGPNPTSIDMIAAGFRTRTTRSESEMAKYAIKVGDIIKHFGKSADGTTKNILAKVTAIHPKGTPGFKGTWAKEGWSEQDVDVIERFKDGAAAIEFELIDTSKPSTQNQTTGLSTYTNHSGGAYGGDTFWDIIGREFGVTKHKHYREQGNTGLSQQLKKAGIEATVLTKEQMDTARAEVKRILGKDYPDTLQGNLQVRNYYQVANADAVYAVAQLADENGRAIRSYLDPTIKEVTGGTNTAVQLGIALNKPVYVWDLGLKSWFEWNGEYFTAMSDTPVLTKNFAGVGSRDIESYNVKNKDGNWVERPQYKGQEIEEAAKQAIRDVYQKTLNPAESELGQETPTISIQDRILELQYQLTQLEANKDDMYASSIPVLTAVNMPKITPESAKRETGVKIGTDKDINIGLIDTNGKTVEAAAEYLMETEFYEELGFPNVDMQDIRDYIIDILQMGKKNFIDQYTNESQIESIKGEIAELKNQANQELEEAEQQYLSTMQSVHYPLFRAAYQEQGGYPEEFAAPNDMIWVKNKFNNYELLDQDGIVYLSNMNMITGKMVPAKKSKLPVNEKLKKDTINQLNVMIKEFRLDEILASKQEDVYGFITKLEAAKTDSEFQDIIAKIQKLIC